MTLDPQNAEGRADMARFAVSNSLGMRLAYVPAGEFDMGSPAAEAGRWDDEVMHHVKLTKGFYLGTTSVTQAQWTALMGTSLTDLRNKGDANWAIVGQGNNYPIYWVTWDEAVSFCESLSRKDGRRYRLPTEAEWEYACRAGTTGAYGAPATSTRWAGVPITPATPASTRTKSFGQTMKITAGGFWRNHCATHPVAQKKPNAWGLYDMHGNILNWCSDWYAPYQEDATDPKGPAEGTSRVLRGGSWYDRLCHCRSANRYEDAPGERYSYFGFRVCLDFD